MSKTADKTANRSHIKKIWVEQGFTPPPPKPSQAGSWWTPAAAPDARGLFIELAQQRAQHPWSSVVPTKALVFL
jgi:hypothetical protein